MDRKHHHRASDLTAPTWRKSSVSGNATQCVEIAELPGGDISVRDAYEFPRD
jgi:hypothetical protein